MKIVQTKDDDQTDIDAVEIGIEKTACKSQGTAVPNQVHVLLHILGVERPKQRLKREMP
jgi:hypothetical protein